jgi:hypothetical protein
MRGRSRDSGSREATPSPQAGEAVLTCGPGSSCGCGIPSDRRALQRYAGNRAVAQAMESAQGPAGGGSLPPSVSTALGEPGDELAPELLSTMEEAFGRDLGGVRVHSGPTAARAADDLGALAFTSGRHIVFGAGQYQPGNAEGRRLLTHELTHVRQQAEGRTGMLSGVGGNESARAALEREAGRHPGPSGGSRSALGNGGGGVTQTALAPAGGAIQLQPVGCLSLLRDPIPSDIATGQLVHAAIRADFRRKVGPPASFSFPDASAGPFRTEGRRGTIDPQTIGGLREGTGNPDLAFRSRTGAAMLVAEIKAANWLELAAGETQLANYLDKGNSPDNAALRARLGVRVFAPMLPSRYRPPRALVVGGRRFRVAWCGPGIIVYKEIKKTKKKKKKKKQDRKKRKQQKKQKKPTKKSSKKSTKKTAKKPKKGKPKGGKKGAKPKGGAQAGAFNFGLGISIGSSGVGAGNVGVGVSIMSSGASAGTVSAGIVYDSQGAAVGAVGAGVSSSSQAAAAGAAGAGVSEDSMSAGAGVAGAGRATGVTGAAAGAAGAGTAEDVTAAAAGVAGSGTARNVTGAAAGVAGSGTAQDVTGTAAGRTASGDVEGGGGAGSAPGSQGGAGGAGGAGGTREGAAGGAAGREGVGGEGGAGGTREGAAGGAGGTREGAAGGAGQREGAGGGGGGEREGAGGGGDAGTPSGTGGKGGAADASTRTGEGGAGGAQTGTVADAKLAEIVARLGLPPGREGQASRVVVDAIKLDALVQRSTPAQKLLLRVLAASSDTGVYTVPDAAWAEMMLTATAGISEKDLEYLAELEWEPANITAEELRKAIQEALAASRAAQKPPADTPKDQRKDPKGTERKAAPPPTKGGAREKAEDTGQGKGEGREEAKGGGRKSRLRKPRLAATPVSKIAAALDGLPWDKAQPGGVYYKDEVKPGLVFGITPAGTRFGALVNFTTKKSGKAEFIQVKESSAIVVLDATKEGEVLTLTAVDGHQIFNFIEGSGAREAVADGSFFVGLVVDAK